MRTLDGGDESGGSMTGSLLTKEEKESNRE